MIIKGKELNDAIKFLRPGANFSFQDEDLSTLLWLDDNSTAPTIEEIEEAKISLKLAANKKESERLALLAKLGITEEEAKLLLS